jgi:hypothetical protein
MALTKEAKQEIITKHGRSDADTGSPQVQIAMLPQRINELTEHLRTHDPRRILGGAKPVSRPLPDPAVSPAGAFPGWPDSSAWQASPARARAGRDGLGER